MPEMDDFIAQGAAMGVMPETIRDAIQQAACAPLWLGDKPGDSIELEGRDVTVMLHRLTGRQVGVHIVWAPNVRASDGCCFAFTLGTTGAPPSGHRWIRRAVLDGPDVRTSDTELLRMLLREAARLDVGRVIRPQQLPRGIELRPYTPASRGWIEHRALVWAASELRNRPLLTCTLRWVDDAWLAFHTWTPADAGVHTETPIEIRPHTAALEKLQIQTLGDLLWWHPLVLERASGIDEHRMRNIQAAAEAAALEWVDGER
jgi:hypothetical protein